MKLSGVVLVALFVTLFRACHSEQLLHSVDGVVGRGNYTYYSLMYEGPITLYLYSVSGDVDLYVSQVNTKPTFEPDTYCLQSSTCGLDIIHIPKDFNRPVGIGVYGHPSHELSTYLLEVYLAEELEYDNSFGSYPDGEEGSDNSDVSGPRRTRNRESTTDDYYAHDKRNSDGGVEDKDVEESFFWTLLWSFIDILVEILFL